MKFDSILKMAGLVTNHEGAQAYAMTPELELYTAVVTASLSDLFYEKRDERVERIANLVSKVSPEFVARLAVYARTEMHLRSIPLLLLVELAKVHNGDDLVARAVEKTVQRADEIMELLMCYQWRNPSRDGRKKLNKLSRQLQKGLQQAFNHFDEYQFAKYDRDNISVKLRDALFVVHPKAKDEQQQLLFDKIASQELAVPYTWETELSALGQQHFENDAERRKAFQAKWEELVASGKLGYMALMRNLRNLLEADVSRAAMMVVNRRLSDPAQVAKSKQLPFRYLSAYREMEKVNSLHTQAVMSALEAAVRHSAANIKGFDENTRVLLASDVSGSMWQSISPRSTVQYYDIGLLLSMLLKSRCQQVIAGIFGDTWKAVNMPGDSILMATSQLRRMEGKVGYSTNGHKVIDWLIDHKMQMDKVMMFTDLQMWDSSYSDKSLKASWMDYKKMAPQARLYLFDLAGYGQSPLRITDEGVYLIAGWSDRIFDVLAAIDNGKNALTLINRVQI
ncbi:MAG: TROVE domain-containing protein [Prevotella sp.]|nr:TROVE domain-containing protein [Prevotella sp.]